MLDAKDTKMAVSTFLEFYFLITVYINAILVSGVPHSDYSMSQLAMSLPTSSRERLANEQ